MLRFLRVLPAALLAAAFPAAAPALTGFVQEPAEARLDATRIGVEDVLTLTVSVPEQRGGAPMLPPLDDFEVLGSQRVSRTSFVNGEMSRAVEWVFRLRPRTTGELVIPGIPVPGYAPAAPLRVTVEPGSLRPARRGSPLVSPFASPFGSLFDPPFDPRDPLRGRGAPEAPSEDDLFIRTEVSVPEVHVGEQSLVLYRLWSRLPIAMAAPVELAQPEGLWSEEVTLPDVPWQERGLDREAVRARRELPGPRRETRTLNGIAYETYPLLLRAVFPTGAGERELPGPRFEIAIEGQGSSIFGPRRVVVVRDAPAATILARPLPDAGRPPGFEGTVGDYRLAASVLREREPQGGGASAAARNPTAAVGDLLVLRLELAGSGNLRAAGTPELPADAAFRSSFRFFDPDTSLETGLAEGADPLTFGGRRVWEFPMAPRSGGVQHIGAITLDVFNPRTGAYERLASDPVSIRVEGAPGPTGIGVGPASALRLGEDIRYLKPVGPARPGGPASGRPGFWLLFSLALPVLANLGIFFGLRRRDYRAAHAAVLRRRGAAREAARRLARIRVGDSGAAAQLGEALSGYAAARLGASSRGLTPEGAAERFVSRGADPETARRFRELLSRAEGARFASGGARGPADRGAEPTHEEAAEVIRALEDQLRGKGVRK